jgi:hypothetical protein
MATVQHFGWLLIEWFLFEFEVGSVLDFVVSRPPLAAPDFALVRRLCASMQNRHVPSEAYLGSLEQNSVRSTRAERRELCCDAPCAFVAL